MSEPRKGIKRRVRLASGAVISVETDNPLDDDYPLQEEDSLGYGPRLSDEDGDLY